MEQELKDLGLSDYEIKAYLTLIREGTATGNKVSKISGVPQGKIYDTLYRLAKKGFVSFMNAKPKLFKAIDPEVALKQFIGIKKSQLEELESSLPKRIKELGAIPKEKIETDEKVSVFRDKKHAFSVSQYILSVTKKSFDMMFTFEILRPITQRILLEKQKKGVDIRILATKKVNLELIKKVISYGFEVRYYPIEEIRIFIKDKEESVIQIVNPRNLIDRTNILIQSKELSRALTDYFDKVWEKAEVLH